MYVFVSLRYRFVRMHASIYYIYIYTHAWNATNKSGKFNVSPTITMKIMVLPCKDLSIINLMNLGTGNHIHGDNWITLTSFFPHRAPGKPDDSEKSWAPLWSK